MRGRTRVRAHVGALEVGAPARDRGPVGAPACADAGALGPVVAAAVFACLFLRQVEQLLELLTTEILHPDSGAPSGVKSHFIEVFLEELAKVGSREVRRGARGARLRAGGWEEALTRCPGPPPTADGGPDPQVRRPLLQNRRPDSGVSARPPSPGFSRGLSAPGRCYVPRTRLQGACWPAGGKGGHGGRGLSPKSPTCHHACCPSSPVVLNNIARGIFEAIVEQAPFAIEDLLNELGEEEASEGAEQEQDARTEEPYEKPQGGGLRASDVTGATSAPAALVPASSGPDGVPAHPSRPVPLFLASARQPGVP